jgi:glutamine synthetase
MVQSVRVSEKEGLERIDELKKRGVRMVRLQYADLHGVARGKVVPLDELGNLIKHGIGFAGAVMTMDLRHNVVAGFETGLPDVLARPDLSTLAQLLWEPEAAWCIADLEEMLTGEPFNLDSRNVLRQVVKKFESIGLFPVVGPELEFYLCEKDPEARGGLKRYQDNDSHVYTTGSFAEPRGVLEYMLENCAAFGLEAYAANHEYGRSQFEINIRHALAMTSADRAFLFKTLVKELAARKGLHATFMGKPWNDDEGSGTHFHLSLRNEQGTNALDNPNQPEMMSDIGMHFIAGILNRVHALMPIICPTINAYRRINAQGLVPTRVNWGFDNRFALIRIPNERGEATRIEIRVADGTANPYLAAAALLAAGLDGIENKLEPPKAVEGFIYDLPEEEQGIPVPTSLEEALKHLEQDEILRSYLGKELVDTFIVVKRAEIGRFSQWVSDWELREYSHHL